MIKRFLTTLFLSLFILQSVPANASFIKKVEEAHQVYRIGKFGSRVFKYTKELKRVSKVPLESRQFKLLSKCVRDRACFTNLKNNAPWNSSVKNQLIKKWELETGRQWPRYLKDVMSSDGKRVVAREGNAYDAHHIIPKNIGGPHEWWNMHPVPRPSHQAEIHAANAILSLLS